ncbi:unnamed protein product [Orchesella dallaii]|uniref:Uncharacterized protein n=1 Tax=Orchesella dallaii TaxID=48710 RepID=A0ABP1RG87_9HEXA
MPVHDVHEILTQLMLLVDNQNPPTREISRQLNDLAESIISGGPEMQQKALRLGAYAIVCRSWIFSCYNETSHNV